MDDEREAPLETLEATDEDEIDADRALGDAATGNCFGIDDA